jgi:voltage-gated potassium channel Kch
MDSDTAKNTVRIINNVGNSETVGDDEVDAEAELAGIVIVRVLLQSLVSPVIEKCSSRIVDT